MEMAVQGEYAHRTSADSLKIFQPFMGMSPEEFRSLASKILVCIPHRPSEGVNKSLFRNAGIWAMLGTPTADVADQFDGFVEMTRGGIVRTFMQYCQDRPEIEYLVMIDNDEGVEWDAPYKLAQWGKDVVSGIVCSFSVAKGGIFACVCVKDRHGVARFPTVKRTKKLPAQGLREIHTAGTGLICIHKRVFEAMLEAEDYPFMIPEDVRRHCCATGLLKMGEDIAFSERCHRHGFKLYVDFSVRAKHYKTVEIAWPDEAIDTSLDAKSWEVADDDYVHA